jgi:cytoskeletal protein CcmA (bactofilin family)
MKKDRLSTGGFALLSVLFIITALSLMFGMLIRISGQRAYTAKRLINEVKALAYAEAGVDFAYSILAIDFDKKDDPSAFQLPSAGIPAPVASTTTSGDTGIYSLMLGQLGGTATNTTAIQSTYGEGSFALSITPVSNKYVIINSVGRCGNAVRIAEILVDDENANGGSITDPTDYSSMEGFNYAVLSGGNFAFGGSGDVSGLKMHSNSSIDIRGNASTELDISSSSRIKTGNVTIEGSLTAPDMRIHQHATITDGTTQAAVPPVGIPDIDLTPYHNWARMNGEVHNGFAISTSYTPAGGVLWVNGDVYIDSHAVINGSIIATGNIYISGQVDINPTTTTFAMASRDGDIINSSSGTLNGLIYAKAGDYAQTANGTLNGQLIVNGTVKKGGESDIINYVRSVPTPPGGPGSYTPTTAWPVVSAWQK